MDSRKEKKAENNTDLEKSRKRKITRTILAILLGIFLAIFGVSLFMIINYYVSQNKEQGVIDDLKEIARSAAEERAKEQEQAGADSADPLESAALPEGGGSGSGAIRGDGDDPDGKNAGKSDFVSQFAVFKDINPDYDGWLYVEGTKIDYPVMYKPDNPEFYSRRTIYGVDSRGGTPFVGPGASNEDDCFYIYGHNMSSGLFFGTLNYYEDPEFGLSHRTFTYETLTERRTYEVFAVLKTIVYYSGFRFYAYAGDLSESRFEEFVKNIKEQSLYDFGVTPEFGEQILVLSTCSYHTPTGRFVVIARRIE